MRFAREILLRFVNGAAARERIYFKLFDVTASNQPVKKGRFLFPIRSQTIGRWIIASDTEKDEYYSFSSLSALSTG